TLWITSAKWTNVTIITVQRSRTMGILTRYVYPSFTNVTTNPWIFIIIKIALTIYLIAIVTKMSYYFFIRNQMTMYDTFAIMYSASVTEPDRLIFFSNPTFSPKWSDCCPALDVSTNVLLFCHSFMICRQRSSEYLL